MANIPVKKLIDESGHDFIPLVTTDSILSTTGETLQEQLNSKQHVLTAGQV